MRDSQVWLAGGMGAYIAASATNSISLACVGVGWMLVGFAIMVSSSGTK